MKLEAIQSAIREAGFDGWLFYDHHHRDPLAASILGLDEKAHITRRWYYYIPATGDPRKLVHRIEQGRLDTLPGAKGQYSSWQELAAGLEAMLFDANRIAMQYSPNNAIMYVSLVDAGTVEFLRSLSKEIVASADLVSYFQAVLSEEQIFYIRWRKWPLIAFWPRDGKRWAGGCVRQAAVRASCLNMTWCSGSARP